MPTKLIEAGCSRSIVKEVIGLRRLRYIPAAPVVREVFSVAPHIVLAIVRKEMLVMDEV